MTNHKSSQWGSEQIAQAGQYGEIVDLDFPDVPPMAEEAEVEIIAEKYVRKILTMKPEAVLCQGEYTMTFSIVHMLVSKGIPVFAACSERQVQEKTNATGETQKLAVFVFKKFREYVEEGINGS